MALFRHFGGVLLASMLAIVPALARAQSEAPDLGQLHPHVEIESRPPDEPASQVEPDLEPAPAASPAPDNSEEGDDDSPPPAGRVAHPPEIETYVVPEYPQKARAQHIEGKVLLMVIIDEAGKVEDDIKVENSVPMLDQAAIDAVHRWSFTPARNNFGAPVRVELEVPIRFTLR